jgi:hypothetical protein
MGGLPRAAADKEAEPYRARTKGKDERGVGYVKHNAVAGHDFISWAALEARLAWWQREIADGRVHGTTGEPPIERFRRAEASALQAINGRPPFRQIRELVRRVQADCAVDLDTNAYSVPWRLIGETVRVIVAGGRVSIRHRDREVAASLRRSNREPTATKVVHFSVSPPVHFRMSFDTICFQIVRAL